MRVVPGVVAQVAMIAALAGCANSGSKSPPPPEATREVPLNAETTPDFSSFEQTARAATSRLQLQLVRELSAAMGEKGVTGAISTCSDRALVVTREVGEAAGVQVRRVSVRNRNPENRATPGEASMLAVMAARHDLTDTLVVRDGVPVYMRAIRIAAPTCLQCHGPRDSIAEDVLRELDERYPEDQATGFRQGDLRGAFVVRAL